MPEIQPELDLVDRLRGTYRVNIDDGAGTLNGESQFVRQFDNLPPIQAEAALEIEQLREQVKRLAERNKSLSETISELLDVIADHKTQTAEIDRRITEMLNSFPKE